MSWIHLFLFIVFFAIGVTALVRLVLWPFRVRWPYQSTIAHAAVWRQMAHNYWVAQVLTVVTVLFIFQFITAHLLWRDVLWISGAILTVLDIWLIRQRTAAQFRSTYPRTMLSLGILYHWMSRPTPPKF